MPASSPEPPHEWLDAEGERGVSQIDNFPGILRRLIRAGGEHLEKDIIPARSTDGRADRAPSTQPARPDTPDERHVVLAPSLEARVWGERMCILVPSDALSEC